jgi:hypothetical protein
MYVVKTKDPIVIELIKELDKRSCLGLNKYGVGLDRKDLTTQQWAKHAEEESLDNALYLRRLQHDLSVSKEE